MSYKLLNGGVVSFGMHGVYVNGVKQTDDKIIEGYQKEMFWSKVAIKANDKLCWEWQAGKNTKGYGSSTFNRVGIAASRKAYMLYHNIQLKDRKILVCHTCDNPSCCNPFHLFLGTSKDNMMDMSRKGRCKGYVSGYKRKKADIQYGSKNPTSKLTEEDVICIRNLSKSGTMVKEIAESFKMAASTISQIVNYKRWKHI